MKIFFASLFTLLSLFAVAQESGKMFLDYNFGLRLGKMTSSQNFTNNSNDLHIDMGFRYMFSDIVGVKAVLGYDVIGSHDELNDEHSKSTMLGGSVQGILSVSKLANFETDQFSLLFHAGVGGTTLFNADFKSENPTYDDTKLFKKNDDLLNISFGLTPQFHFNESVALQGDFSYVLLAMQNRTADFRGNASETMGSYMNATLGLVFTLK